MNSYQYEIEVHITMTVKVPRYRPVLLFFFALITHCHQLIRHTYSDEDSPVNILTRIDQFRRERKLPAPFCVYSNRVFAQELNFT